MDSYMEKMVLRACNCDMGGLWRPGAVLETMQESAGYPTLSGYLRDLVTRRRFPSRMSRPGMAEGEVRGKMNRLIYEVNKIGVNYNQVVSLYHQQSRSGSAGLNTRSLDGKMTELMRMTEGLRDEFALFLDVMRTYLGDEPANQ